jgi:hypothetical protein
MTRPIIVRKSVSASKRQAFGAQAHPVQHAPLLHLAGIIERALALPSEAPISAAVKGPFAHVEQRQTRHRCAEAP